MSDLDKSFLENFCNEILDMKIKDFLILCAEHKVNIELVTSSITVCCFKLSAQLSLEEKIGADNDIMQDSPADK